jgi:hypothetical protein
MGRRPYSQLPMALYRRPRNKKDCGLELFRWPWSTLSRPGLIAAIDKIKGAVEMNGSLKR